jgi:hypothetical protein
MLPIKETDIATNGIHLRVTELGEGPRHPFRAWLPRHCLHLA